MRCPKCSADLVRNGFQYVDEFECGTATVGGFIHHVGPQCRLNEALSYGRRLISHADGVVPVASVEKLVGMLSGGAT